MTTSNRGKALITGASSGIGACFARRLAADGYDLILVARRKERLEELAAELGERFSVGAEAMVADLSKPEEIGEVASRIESLEDLEILVNNAGFGAGGRYFEIDIEKQIDMIQVHVVATARLTRAALPQMARRKSGAVINVASLTAFMAMPRSAMYCATKTWQRVFSESLAKGLRKHGIRIQALCPGLTYTEFHDRPEYGNFKRSSAPKFLWMKSEAVVDASMRCLAKGKTVCIPGLANRALAFLLQSPLGPLLMKMTIRKQERIFPEK